MRHLKGFLNPFFIQYYLLLAFLSCVSFPLFSSTMYQLPIDKNIGQIVDVMPGSVEERAYRALSEPYSLSWMESYVPASMLSGFAFTYDRMLASLLPVSQLQISRAIKRGQLYEVSFCYHSPSYGYGGTTWMQNEDGEFVLLSITLEQ